MILLLIINKSNFFNISLKKIVQSTNIYIHNHNHNNKMDCSLLSYYIIKRLFLFFDEWLFYCVLIYLFNRKYYKIAPFVMLYGIACIYTSYSNIDKIEEKLTDVHQIIWLSNKPALDYVYDGAMICLNFFKKLIS